MTYSIMTDMKVKTVSEAYEKIWKICWMDDSEEEYVADDFSIGSTLNADDSTYITEDFRSRREAPLHILSMNIVLILSST